MKLFSLGEVLREIEPHERRPEDSLIVVSNFREAKSAMQLANMVYDGEINRTSIDLCKLEAQQVRDAYQTEVDSRQNENMKFLTVLSTSFFPLTLITGWYGMNFENMPELQNGYPGVILFSLLVVAGLIFLCKRKNIF